MSKYSNSSDMSAPASDAFAVTKSDSTIFDPPVKGLYIGVTGNVTVKTLGGTTVEFIAVPAGTQLAVACTQVRSATTASSIVGLR